MTCRSQAARWSDLSVQGRLDQTVFLVELRSERHLYPRLVSWEQIMEGSSFTIGTLAGMPVQLLLVWVRLNGHLVALYEATSQVVDHRLVEAWLSDNCRAPRCDAMNFHRCTQAVADMEQTA